MSEANDNLSDEAAVKVLKGILGEMIEIGEAHAETISKLPEEFRVQAMQLNTLLSVATMLLYKFAEEENVEAARRLVDVWTSETVQQLVALAFKDEIAEAYKTIDDGIDSLEKLVNEEENSDPSSRPSD